MTSRLHPYVYAVLSFVATLCLMLATQADDGLQLGEVLQSVGAALLPGGIAQRAHKAPPPANG